MKLKKALKMSLAVALVFGSVGALAGCGKDDNTAQTEKTEQEKVYDLYVAYMSAKGETPQTYEQWLASIKGQKGDKGDPGTPGAAGVDGATWLSGTDEPTSTDGKDGDFYFETDAQKIWKRTGTTWSVVTTIEDGAAGDPGNPGANGATWLTGVVAPTNQGVDGDFYFDSVAQKIYNKVDGAWALITTIEDGAAGNPGNPGEPGTPGKDGNTWLSDEGEPEATVGKEGDFYFDETGKDVYKKTASGWEKVASLDEEEVAVSYEGKYVSITEDEGDGSMVIEVVVDENSEITSVLMKNIITIEAGPLLNMGLVPVAVEDNVVTLAFYAQGVTPIQLEAGTTYTVNQIMEIEVEPGFPMPCQISGTLNGTDIVEATMTIAEDFSDYMVDYSIEGEIIKVNVGGDVMYYKMGDEFEYNSETVTAIEPTFYVEEDDEALLYGVYEDWYNNGDYKIAISKNKAIGQYNGIYINGTIEYIDGSVDSGNVYAIIDTDRVTLNVRFDLNNRAYEIEDEDVTYKFAGRYYSMDILGEDNCLEITKTDDVYAATINETPVTFVVDSVSGRYMYATVTVEDVPMTIRLDAGYRQVETCVLPSAVYSSIENNVSYIKTNIYNQAQETNVDELATNDNWYTHVGTLNDMYNEVTELTINEDYYNKEIHATTVGNNKKVNKTLWYVDEGNVYVSSLLLKSIAIRDSGVLTINANGTEFEYNFTQYANEESYPAWQGDVYYGTDAELNQAGTLWDNGPLNITDGTTSFRIELGTDDKYANMSVFTIKNKTYNYNNEENYYGYTTVDKIGDTYYLIVYPSYDADGYEETTSLEFNYQFILEDGTQGRLDFNLELVQQN